MKILLLMMTAGMLMLTPGHASAASAADVEALSAVMTVDRNEINAAEAALAKSPGKDVEDYADMMKSHHTKNLEKTQELAQKLGLMPVDTDRVRQLRADGEKDMAMLTPLSGSQFSTAYIDAMVQGHAKALDMIDQQLMPSVQEEQVKKHLTETRKVVNMHLERAKKLQSKQTQT